MSPDVVLAIAALTWFGIHPVIAGSKFRSVLVQKLGDRAYQSSFSLLSIASLAFLIWAYRRAPCDPLWLTPEPLYFLPLLSMPLAFVFLVGAFTVPNPMAGPGDRAFADDRPARGMQRVTRHPFLWAVILWSGSHLIVNGNVPALLFFGSFLLTAAVGTRDIDRKRLRADPEGFRRYATLTSNFPFLAIASGRNQLNLRELVVPIAVGLILTAALLHFHQSWFGLSALRALR
jgi:uncharacterized membrane protein